MRGLMILLLFTFMAVSYAGEQIGENHLRAKKPDKCAKTIQKACKNLKGTCQSAKAKCTGKKNNGKNFCKGKGCTCCTKKPKPTTPKPTTPEPTTTVPTTTVLTTTVKTTTTTPPPTTTTTVKTTTTTPPPTTTTTVKTTTTTPPPTTTTTPPPTTTTTPPPTSTTTPPPTSTSSPLPSSTTTGFSPTMSTTPTGSFPTWSTDSWSTPAPPPAGGGCYNPLSGANDIPVTTQYSSQCQSYICTYNGWVLLQIFDTCCMFDEVGYPEGTTLTITKKYGACVIICVYDPEIMEYIFVKMDPVTYYPSNSTYPPIRKEALGDAAPVVLKQ